MEMTRFSHSVRWHFCPQSVHFPQKTALFRINFYKCDYGSRVSRTDRNVAVVKQGLLPHTIFYGRRFKELFIEPTLVLSLCHYLQIAHSFQSQASQTFAPDLLQKKFHQQVYKYVFLVFLEQPIIF